MTLVPLRVLLELACRQCPLPSPPMDEYDLHTIMNVTQVTQTVSCIHQTQESVF